MKRNKRSKLLQKMMVYRKARGLAFNSNKLCKVMATHDIGMLAPGISRTIATVTASLSEAFEVSSADEKLKYFQCARQALSQCKHYLLLVHEHEGWKIGKLLTEAHELSSMLQTQIEALKK